LCCPITGQVGVCIAGLQLCLVELCCISTQLHCQQAGFIHVS
jgi:hypothetical protein